MLCASEQPVVRRDAGRYGITERQLYAILGKAVRCAAGSNGLQVHYYAGTEATDTTTGWTGATAHFKAYDKNGIVQEIGLGTVE